MKGIPASLIAGAAALAVLLTASPSYSQRPPAPPVPCADSDTKTHILFPFVSNQAGFDTGFAIANTTTDPFGTVGVAGACTLNFYSSPISPAPASTGIIAQGATYTGLVSSLAHGFQGYMIATCNFPLAHGFSFISETGVRNLAAGYLPTNVCSPRVIPN
jgi:hypothetical protein